MHASRPGPTQCKLIDASRSRQRGIGQLMPTINCEAASSCKYLKTFGESYQIVDILYSRAYHVLCTTRGPGQEASCRMQSSFTQPTIGVFHNIIESVSFAYHLSITRHHSVALSQSIIKWTMLTVFVGSVLQLWAKTCKDGASCSVHSFRAPLSNIRYPTLSLIRVI